LECAKEKDRVEECELECELVDPRGEQEAPLVVLNPVDSGTDSDIIPPFEKHYVRTRRNEAKQPYQVEDQYQLPPPINSSLLPTDSGDISISDLHLPITQRKEIRLCTLNGSTAPSTSHPISDFVSLDKLSPTFKAFTTSLHSAIVPCDWKIAMQDPMWKAAMFEEMRALTKNGTWKIISKPAGKKTVGCKWVFTVKHNPKGKVERLKARLVAKGYTQTYGIDYKETFAPVAKMNMVRTLISCAVNFDWNIHQLDVNNAFLHGDLKEEVYMELPPGFDNEQVAGKVCRLKRSLYGLKQSPRA
jgi:Reverse transcriptase (RNA-dependent DNA polymerase)